MNIVLLGGPGAGKGTLAASLLKHYNMQHFSTGDLLREAVANNTTQGLEAKKYMESGNLVPDELIVGIMRERLSSLDNTSQGVILDGFPRTTEQAKALDTMLNELSQKVDLVLLLECPDQVVIERICNRRICEDCGYIGNLNWIDASQRNDYRCPDCGGKMGQRDDDTEQTIVNRLSVYSKQTAPLIEYYSNSGTLNKIDASENAEKSFTQAKVVIDKLL